MASILTTSASRQVTDPHFFKNVGLPWQIDVKYQIFFVNKPPTDGEVR